MSKKLLTLIALAYATNTMAQITISGNDLPVVNHPYIRDKASNTSVIDLNVTGPNSTWDYTTLNSSGMDTIKYSSVSSTNFAYQLYFNNPLQPNYNSDLAIEGMDFPTIPNVPITVTNVINYFKIANDAYYQTGFGATISSIPTSNKYTPRDKVFPLPCTFGVNESNPFEWGMSIPNIGYYGQRKTRTVEVDGWGTLKLPNGGTYDVLRVKSTIEGVDTIYIDQLSNGFGIPSTTLEYKWYAVGEGEPVLTVTATSALGTQIISGVNYKHHEPSGIKTMNLLNTSLDVFPNPVVDLLQLHYYTPIPGDVQISISNLSGEEVYSETQTCIAAQNNLYRLNVQSLASGLYILKITQKGQTAAAKLHIL